MAKPARKIGSRRTVYTPAASQNTEKSLRSHQASLAQPKYHFTGNSGTLRRVVVIVLAFTTTGEDCRRRNRVLRPGNVI